MDRSGPGAGLCPPGQDVWTTRSGRSVSPCSAIVALSVCGMACPWASTVSGSSSVCCRTNLIQARCRAGCGRALLMVFPFCIRQAQRAGLVWVMRVKALRKDMLQHGHGQERTGHFHQRKPVRMMPLRRGRGRHTVVSVSQGFKIILGPSLQESDTLLPPETAGIADRQTVPLIAAVSCVISSGIAWTRARKASMFRSNCSRSGVLTPAETPGHSTGL